MVQEQCLDRDQIPPPFFATKNQWLLEHIATAEKEETSSPTAVNHHVLPLSQIQNQPVTPLATVVTVVLQCKDGSCLYNVFARGNFNSKNKNNKEKKVRNHSTVQQNTWYVYVLTLKDGSLQNIALSSLERLFKYFCAIQQSKLINILNEVEAHH